MPLPFEHLVGARSNSCSPRAQPQSKDVANGPKKEPLDSEPKSQENGSAEDDPISKHLSELQEELFLSLKEDISDWINKTLGDVDMNADNFIHSLDTGVILCRLSLAIEKKAKEAFKQGKLPDIKTLPDFRLHLNNVAKSGTWFARDNTANFLSWCRAYGMIDETLFDSEDLVTHHQERQVIYCLMELARLGYKFGLEPPSLIAMEKEIENGSPLPSPVVPPPPILEIVPKEKPAPPPSPPRPPPPKAPVSPPKAPVSPPCSSSTMSSPPRSIRSSSISTLDSEVNRVTKKCKCQEYVNRLSEGVYDVFGKRVYIRLLKGKHLMVRVGGGWDTFENYLLHHDPIQVFEFHAAGRGPTRSASHSYAVADNNVKPGAFNGYLVIRSKYKSTNFS